MNRGNAAISECEDARGPPNFPCFCVVSRELSMIALWFWDSTIALNKRRWCYVQSPAIYEMAGCPICGHPARAWSEYERHLWCDACKIDFIPEHAGVFDGPIPVATCAMLGIRFDRLNLETNEIEPFVVDFGRG